MSNRSLNWYKLFKCWEQLCVSQCLGYGLDDLVCNSRKEQEMIFFSKKRLDRLSGPPSIILFGKGLRLSGSGQRSKQRMLLVCTPWEHTAHPDECRKHRISLGRFLWPRVLRRGSAASRLLGLRVRVPPEAWMSVYCECYVLSVRGLCEGPIPRPEEPYPVCVCVIECEQAQ
jgi:hypothetical protein